MRPLRKHNTTPFFCSKKNILFQAFSGLFLTLSIWDEVPLKSYFFNKHTKCLYNSMVFLNHVVNLSFVLDLLHFLALFQARNTKKKCNL